MKITQFDKRHLLASVKLAGDNYVLLCSLPGYSKWVDRDLKFRPNAANIEYILTHWPDSEWSIEAQAWRNTLEEKRTDAGDTAKLKQLADSEFKSNFDFKTKPYDHQAKAFLLSRDRKTFALFMEQGTGKTKVVLDNAAYLAFLGLIDMLIVIAPKGVHENWTLNEAPKHFPDWIEYESWAFTTNTAKYRLRERDRVLDSDKFKIITINIEGFTGRKGKASKSALLLEDCLDRFRCMVVVDESSRIKHPSAKRTRYLTKACRDASYRRILSGTPVTQGMEDLYSQFGFLDYDIIGYDTYTSFKSRYCIIREVNYGSMVVGYRNEGELVERIDGFSFRVLKAECLDLPPKIYKSFPIHLTSRQASLYNELIEEYQVEMDGETLTIELAITRLLRLQQIVGGWFKSDQSDKLRSIDDSNERIKALQTVLRDVHGKVVIWARFIADLDLIASELGPTAIRYEGDLGDVDRFQNDESARFFVANPASAGLGLTLTAAETVIYYSNSFDLEHRLQSEDRTHRIGTVNPVTYIDLCTSGTIDVKIVNALRNKKLVSDAVLQDPESFFMEYIDA